MKLKLDIIVQNLCVHVLKVIIVQKVKKNLLNVIPEIIKMKLKLHLVEHVKRSSFVIKKKWKIISLVVKGSFVRLLRWNNLYHVKLILSRIWQKQRNASYVRQEKPVCTHKWKSHNRVLLDLFVY
jgi:hypothetical protein